MKNRQVLILTILLIFLSVKVQAQFGEQLIITEQANGVRKIVVGDIDNDGFKDILFSSKLDSYVGWIKNIDNGTSFGEIQVIGSADQTSNSSLADIDSDGDLDVLAITGSQDKVYWFENTDGLGTFGSRQTIAINIDGAFKAEGADVNGDGFMDVVVSAMNELEIYWFENVDGNNTFGAKQIVANAATIGRYFNLVDIDNDGDVDCVSSGAGNQITSWYRNDGLGNFSPPIAIAGAGQAVLSLYSEDIDGDGDIDVITPSGGDDQLAWYENLDGQGTFGGKNIISNSVIDVICAFAADLDNDGDVDVLSASANDFGNISWYENTDGEGAFGPQQIIFADFNVSTATVAAADMDNDGDIDALSTTFVDDKIAWYRNNTILNNEVFLTTSLKIYPNPTKTVLNIVLDKGIIDSVLIYDVKGAKVLSENLNTSQINIASLAKGVYFLKVFSAKKSTILKFIKE